LIFEITKLAMIRKAALTNLIKSLALLRFNEARLRPGAVVEMMEQDDHRWTVTIVWDDAEPALAFEDLEAFDETVAAVGQAPVHVPVTEFAPADLLGRLSQKFESNGKSGAIGFDTKGGFSYGTYQIATKTGTMDKFLRFLITGYASFADSLQRAGGVVAALAGTSSFKDAWTALAVDPSFTKAQHQFIEETHYRPFANKLLLELHLDVALRTAVLRDVVWSVAVQHGSSNSIFGNALVGKNASNLPEREIIEAVYAERSKVSKYFPSSSVQVKSALVARFQEELAMALSRLA
jgi:hypothetical protein